MWVSTVAAIACLQSAGGHDPGQGQALVPKWLGSYGFYSVSELEPEEAYAFARLYVRDRATEAAVLARAGNEGITVYITDRRDDYDELQRIVYALGRDAQALVDALAVDRAIHGFAYMGTIDPTRSRWVTYMPHRYLLFEELDELTGERGLELQIQEEVKRLGFTTGHVCRISVRKIAGRKSLDVFVPTAFPALDKHLLWFQLFEGLLTFVGDVPEAERLNRAFLTRDGSELRG